MNDEMRAAARRLQMAAAGGKEAQKMVKKYGLDRGDTIQEEVGLT